MKFKKSYILWVFIGVAAIVLFFVVRNQSKQSPAEATPINVAETTSAAEATATPLATETLIPEPTATLVPTFTATFTPSPTNTPTPTPVPTLDSKVAFNVGAPEILTLNLQEMRDVYGYAQENVSAPTVIGMEGSQEILVDLVQGGLSIPEAFQAIGPESEIPWGVPLLENIDIQASKPITVELPLVLFGKEADHIRPSMIVADRQISNADGTTTLIRENTFEITFNGESLVKFVLILNVSATEFIAGWEGSEVGQPQVIQQGNYTYISPPAGGCPYAGMNVPVEVAQKLQTDLNDGTQTYQQVATTLHDQYNGFNTIVASFFKEDGTEVKWDTAFCVRDSDVEENIRLPAKLHAAVPSWNGDLLDSTPWNYQMGEFFFLTTADFELAVQHGLWSGNIPVIDTFEFIALDEPQARINAGFLFPQGQIWPHVPGDTYSQEFQFGKVTVVNGDLGNKYGIGGGVAFQPEDLVSLFPGNYGLRQMPASGPGVLLANDSYARMIWCQNRFQTKPGQLCILPGETFVAVTLTLPGAGERYHSYGTYDFLAGLLEGTAGWYSRKVIMKPGIVRMFTATILYGKTATNDCPANSEDPGCLNIYGLGLSPEE